MTQAFRPLGAAALIAGALLMGASPALGDEYTIVDLGSLGGGTTLAFGIGEDGEVVGTSSVDAGPGSDSHAFLWREGAMIDLGTLGGANSQGLAVTESGRVTGFAEAADGFQHAFLWEDGVLTDLAAAFPGVDSAGRDLNESGQVAGNLDLAAVLWDNGVLIDLGNLGGGLRRAYGINEAGEVVGDASVTTFLHAFYWQDDGKAGTSDMWDLGPAAGGLESRARAINDEGQVVGWADTPGGGLGDAHAVLWENLSWDEAGGYTGDLVDLGTLPGGDQSFALGINDRGQVVGYATVDAGGTPHAFLYEPDTGMQDLNDLLPPGSGWLLQYALDINDDREIAGYGRLGGETRGFLLTQVPDVVECGAGGVNGGCGPIEEVVLVNGEAGGADRTVVADAAAPLSCVVMEPGGERGDGEQTSACLYAWLGDPGSSDLVQLPKNLGAMCFGPVLLATKTPKKIWNAIGFVNKLGEHTGPGPRPVIPDGGSFEFLSLPAGVGRSLTVTFQGIIEDACSQGTVPYSVTNGVVLEIP